MNKKFTLVVLMIFWAVYSSKAQKDFYEGYIITHQNDTLRGKIKDKFIASKVRLRDSLGNEKDFKASEISGYSKAGVYNYLSISIESGMGHSFGRIIEDGEMVLLERSATYMTMVNNGGSAPTGVSSTNINYYLYNRKTKVATIIYEVGFKDQVTKYFKDYPELKEMILNKELRYGDLQIIVRKYNIWKAKQ